jgi:hypothetical protein
MDMDKLIPCPICRYDNPLENRFCGRCGASLTSSKPLAPRQEEHSPATVVRALPAKLGPTGKALAVGLAALAAEAGLLWLRRRVERTDHTPLPGTQNFKPAVPEYLLIHSLEEVTVWLQEGDSCSHIFARREERSLGAVKPADARE